MVISCFRYPLQEIAMSRKKRRRPVSTEFHAATEAEALFLEQAQAYFRDVQDVANKAPDGIG